jgi:hypothetical protein
VVVGKQYMQATGTKLSLMAKDGSRIISRTVVCCMSSKRPSGITCAYSRVGNGPNKKKKGIGNWWIKGYQRSMQCIRGCLLFIHHY